MTKADCFSKGCPFIIKKTDVKSLQSYYVCGVLNRIIKSVRVCPKNVLA